MGLDTTVDLTPVQRQTILNLLDRHLPGTEVWAFGSRVSWEARPESDLDLVVFTKPEQARRVAALREAFTDSSLPFSVDLLVWDETPDEFRPEIQRQRVEFISARIENRNNTDELIKIGWRWATIGEFMAVNQETYRLSENWKHINYLDTSNITENKITNWQHINLEEQKIPARARRKIKEGDIVYSTVRPNQKHFGLARNLPENALASTGFATLRSKYQQKDGGFFYWHLTQEHVVDNFQAIAEQSTSAYPSIRASDIASFKVFVPPKDRRKTISDILTTLDYKIEANRRMNETLEAMARALFKDWFVDFGPTRAKMEGRAPYLAPEIWNLFPDKLDKDGRPQGWEEKPLDEIANFLNGLALQKFPPEDQRDSLPAIKIAELRNGITNKSNRASRNVSPQYVVQDGDFLFSWSGSLLARFWIGGEGALNQHLFKVTSDRYPAWFFSEWVQHHMEEFQKIAASKATTMGHIQRGHLKTATTICPPDIAIKRMGELIAPLVDRTIHNALESRTLAQTRDFLLPKLMSGEIRVSEAKRVVRDVG